MATYLGQTLRLTAKSAPFLPTPALDPAPASGITGTLLNFPNFTDFIQYNGANAIFYKSRFNKNSKILIQRIRLSIPNLAGIRLAPGLNDSANGSRIYVGRASDTINAGNSDYVDFNLTDLNEWIPVNLLVQALPDIGLGIEDFHITPLDQSCWVDTRNLQAIYVGKEIYMQVDIDVYSPLEMVVL